MIHVNPSSPNEYILELLSLLPEILFHSSSLSDRVTMIIIDKYIIFCLFDLYYRSTVEIIVRCLK